MDKFSIIILSCILLAILVAIVGAFRYENSTEIITIETKIVDKYVHEKTGAVPIGEFWYPAPMIDYFLLCEDGSEYEVTKETFNKYQIGDIYTYNRRVRK